MRPLEVLKQEFEAINRKMDNVVFPCTKYCDTGLSMPFENSELKKIPDGSLCKLYEHKLFTTRSYRHEGSAVYKLIKALHQATQNKSKIYWRFKPEVIINKDFNSQRKVFVGRVRFSCF